MAFSLSKKNKSCSGVDQIIILKDHFTVIEIQSAPKSFYLTPVGVIKSLFYAEQ